jgi:hypothetical protein
MAIDRLLAGASNAFGAKQMLMSTAGALAGDLRTVLTGMPTIFDGVPLGDDGGYIVPMSQFSTARKLLPGGATIDEDPTVGQVNIQTSLVYHSFAGNFDAMDTDTLRNRFAHFHGRVTKNLGSRRNHRNHEANFA